ncbi:amidohydrolase family protein [bacterium]|nr:amidohydrolase family protein [bacterium]
MKALAWFTLSLQVLCFCPSARADLMVLKDVNIVDIRNGTSAAHQDLVLSGDTISFIGPHAQGRGYEGIVEFDCTGDYVIPGLIEGHVHVTGVKEESLTLVLKHGVTAVRDMGGDVAYLKELQAAIQSGSLLGPDIYYSALLGGRELIMTDARVRLATPPAFELGQAPWARLVEEDSPIRSIITEARGCGATGIKMYSSLSAELCRRLAEEAHRQHLKVWAHASVYPTTVEDVLSAMVDVVSHVSFLLFKPGWDMARDGTLAFDPNQLNSARLDSIFQTMKRNNIRLDPTLSILNWQVRSIQDRSKAHDLISLACQVVKTATEQGISLVVGTDCPLPQTKDEKLMLYNEMELLVHEVGLSPAEVLRAVTLNNAEILGIAGTNGTIEVGKRADMVVLDDNPLIRIEAVEHPRLIIKKGILIDPIDSID